MRRLSVMAMCAAALLAGCGGGSTTIGAAGTGTAPAQGLARAVPLRPTRWVTVAGGSFQSGMIGLSSTTLSAGGTASLDATIVDQTGTLYTGATVTVTFNSPCVAQGLAAIAASGSSTPGPTAGTVTTSTGSISATYTAKGCSGADVITATATVGTKSLTATGTLTVAAAASDPSNSCQLRRCRSD